MSDKSARMLARVRLVENETGRTYTAADRRPTKHVGSWESRPTRRHSRDDPREDVGEEVRVGVGVRVRIGAAECQLNCRPVGNSVYRQSTVTSSMCHGIDFTLGRRAFAVAGPLDRRPGLSPDV